MSKFSPLPLALSKYYTAVLEEKQWVRAYHKVIRFVIDAIDWVITIITHFTLGWKSKQQLPPINSDLIHLSATQLAQRIRNREVRCVDLVETYIKRIQDVQPIINSVVDDRFEEALKEAKAVDDYLNGFDSNVTWENKPLLGVPISIKESISVKGLSNNAARSRVKHHIAEEDADVVASLREAGAIPLVVTNTPELCINWETTNRKYGRTNNPYDSRRTVAGSSGGEASLLGAGGSVVGIASDIGGSLRLPASFTGVYGHKSTPGFVSPKGHIPSSKDQMWEEFFTMGPMTRYAEDLPLVLKTIISDKTKRDKLRLDESVDISKIKIYYMYGEGKESILQKEPGVEAVAAITKAVSVLKEVYQCQVEMVKIEELVDSVYLNCLILQMKGIENVFQKNDKDPDDWGMLEFVEVLMKKVFRSDAPSLPCILYGIVKALADQTPSDIKTQLKNRLTLIQDKLLMLLDKDAVLLYPTFPDVAPFHNRMCTRMFDISYCSIFNLLGLPVTQCPIHITREGLPIGIQIVGGKEEDRLCLGVARALEKELGGWVPPVPHPTK